MTYGTPPTSTPQSTSVACQTGWALRDIVTGAPLVSVEARDGQIVLRSTSNGNAVLWSLSLRQKLPDGQTAWVYTHVAQLVADINGRPVVSVSVANGPAAVPQLVNPPLNPIDLLVAASQGKEHLDI